MATGQNNNNRNNRNSKIPNNQPVRRRRKKQQVPGAVILIYVLMILLVLSICALIFVITLNNTGWNGRNPGDDESLEVNISSNVSSEPDSVSSDEPSSDLSDSSDISSDSSDTPSDWSSEENPSSWSSEPNSNSTTTSSDTTVFLPTNYDTEFFSDDLFIGDSIFTGLYLYGYLEQANVAAAVGYTPYKAMHSAFNAAQYSGSATDYAAERKPKRIFIMLGSNTMAAGTDFDVIVTQYETMLTSLKQNCSGSDICVISIPPVTSDSSAAVSANINNSDINSVNAKLKTMADGAGVRYFDLNEMLSDDNGYFMKDYAEMDGLHFKGATYKVLLSALQKEFT